VVREVQQWVEKGVKEIILVAQDTTAFGLDGSDTGDLPALLRALDQVDGLEWVRIMYAHPARVTPALVEAMAEGGRICPYLDLPIQHINAAILKQMNRRTGPEEIRRVIRQLREAVPGIHLRTSVIVGFPGETESAFQELLDFVEEIRFEWLGAFAYSREENTAAASLGPEIAEKVVQDRLSRLMERQQAITGDLMKQWVSREVRVLVGRKVATTFGEAVGRTSFQAPDIDGVVYLKGPSIIPGQIQSACITDSLDYDLIGEIQDVA
jgi:ribosomal protein S12 methylthiotransferase